MVLNAIDWGPHTAAMFDDQRVDLAKIAMENRKSMDFKKQMWGFNKKCGFIQENIAFESTKVGI